MYNIYMEGFPGAMGTGDMHISHGKDYAGKSPPAHIYKIKLQSIHVKHTYHNV